MSAPRRAGGKLGCAFVRHGYSAVTARSGVGFDLHVMFTYLDNSTFSRKSMIISMLALVALIGEIYARCIC
jgi:hypothetical protein